MKIAILGIDAAWTPHKPSGIALIRQAEAEKWECVAVEDSYQDFLNRSGIGFNSKATGNVPVAELLEAVKILSEAELKLVVADIPLAKGLIVGRRRADNEISRLFGRKGCSTHTPSQTRPGPISEEIRDGFEKHGYTLATASADRLPGRALIETYPHPALLLLMNKNYRVPYKISKAGKYFPTLSSVDRRAAIAQKLQDVHTALSQSISRIDIAISEEPQSLRGLKSIEDRIDALVCAWVGIHVLQGNAQAIGDGEAAIWLPSKLFQPTDWSALLAPEARASEEFMLGIEELPLEHRAFESR